MDPQLEARLHEDFEDPAARRAYGTALRERGDPRGELMLLALEEAPEAKVKLHRLIDEHWGEWFGDLGPDEILAGWRHGMVRRLCVVSNVSQRAFIELLGSPPMAFLETLEAGQYQGHLFGVHLLPSLRRLVAPVWEALEGRSELQGFGAGLTLEGSARELRTWRDQLKRSYPGVKLRPRLPDVEIDSFFAGGEAYETPQVAPSFPGLGPPTIDDRPVRDCGACASSVTTALVAVERDGSILYEHRCNECGWYTHFEHFTQKPAFPEPPKRAATAQTALLLH